MYDEQERLDYHFDFFCTPEHIYLQLWRVQFKVASIHLSYHLWKTSHGHETSENPSNLEQRERHQSETHYCEA